MKTGLIRRGSPCILAGAAALTLSATMLASATAATPSGSGDPGRSPTSKSDRVHKADNRPGPLTARQQRLRQKALALRENGVDLQERRGGGATLAMPQADGEVSYYEFPVNRTDKVFTILSEFGGEGPLRNQIPQPRRAENNATYWVHDFDKAHYDEMFGGDGESFTDYFRQLSGGRYDVRVTTEDWVRVPDDGASYGDNRVEESGGAWQFITDTVNAWYADQKAVGKTDEEIRAHLAQFDAWDRYDHDNDGNFNERDGYIDHFQAIHAGEGEEAGGGTLGSDAIWSHRWYVATGYGQTGPEGNPLGGAQIGTSGIWVGDYTVEPENGGLGIFAHEYGHDLGLPDYYDTARGENTTAFWTLMSSGSWLGHGAEADEGIGTVPNLMGPQEKYELGWLDHTEVDPGTDGTFRLAPAQHTYDDPATDANEADQAIKVNLPDKTTSTPYTTPPEGTHAWWTGRGDDIDHTLQRSVGAARAVTVTASVWHQIEAGYDYLWAEYSTDGGQSWRPIGRAVDGSSGNRWVGKRWSYRPGGESLFRLRYTTDGGVNLAGAFLDQITIKSDAGTVTDGAEAGTAGWNADGWTISTGTETRSTPLYYLMENRQYVGYDDTLRTGPYQFSEAYTRPNWVEFFSFQEGMLVWLVDHAYADNNVSQHPGHGQAMPVDARPEPFSYADGTRPSNRRQPFDATFGLSSVPETCLHKQVLSGRGANQTIETMEACAPASAAIPSFRDTGENAYWTAANPQGSTKLPGSGVSATVTAQDGDVLTVAVHNPAAGVR